MTSTNKLLIAIISIVIIIIIIISGILIYQNRGRIFYGVDEIEQEPEKISNEPIKRVINRNDFYAIETCVKKYYLYYTQVFETENEEYYDEEEDIEQIERFNVNALYSMLDEEYISAKQITTNNLKSKLKKLEELNVDITDMYVSDKTNNTSVYVVEGILRQKVSGEISKFKIMVKIDALNRTFSILPQDYVEEKYPEIKIGERIKINVPEKIDENEFNMYDLTNITDANYVEDLFSKFVEEILYNAELAYDTLDTEYKNKRFGTVNEFREYAKNNIKRFVIAKVDKYQKTQTDGYMQYVCLDTDGKYYIFREIAPKKYTLLLDTYTIDIPEFVTKYEASNPQEKVILNINKFLLAINEKDYKYAYSVLADSFKANNFKTQQEFENYIKTRFFEENEFSYQKFGDEANTYYTYEIKITDAAQKSDKEIIKTFIILLENGTDFKLSFNA